ncbi:MAG TPA: M20/M25/M40 family metallo-hydrolase [Gemmatimonadales bacterium]|nr:M20/M25/M40 family metallo-hydrolase [Gemmatimonadales bacterium]
MSGIRRALPALLCGLLPATALVAQAPPPATRPGATAVAASDTTATARIIREIAAHQHAVSDVEHLADVIGPRLTGSERLLRAHAWAESTLTARGAVNVHREGYAFGPSWTRGPARARLLTQNGGTLTLAALGWSRPTPGPVRGDLLVVTGRTTAELERFIGRFKGRIVTFGETPPIGADSVAYHALRDRLALAMREEGALAYLAPAGKKEGLGMTGGPVWRLGSWAPQIPFAFVAMKDYMLIRRAADRGERVTLELDLPGTTSRAPVRAFNTVAELRGTDLSDEVVILGAHLDSWDLGTGATDNGTGVAGVMEALRGITAAGLEPRRTIRVVLFSGEEQGHFGSKAYVEAHRAELARVQAVLVLDLGTGKVRGFALQGREDCRRLMGAAIAPLNDLGVVELPLERSDDSDHAAFNDAGVPAFFAVQDTLDYFRVTHHSQYDTFERVDSAQLVQGATAIAVTAWELATMPARLPHGP